MTTTHVILIAFGVCWACAVVFIILVSVMLKLSRWAERRGQAHRARHSERRNA